MTSPSQTDKRTRAREAADMFSSSSSSGSDSDSESDSDSDHDFDSPPRRKNTIPSPVLFNEIKGKLKNLSTEKRLDLPENLALNPGDSECLLSSSPPRKILAIPFVPSEPTWVEFVDENSDVKSTRRKRRVGVLRNDLSYIVRNDVDTVEHLKKPDASEDAEMYMIDVNEVSIVELPNGNLVGCKWSKCISDMRLETQSARAVSLIKLRKEAQHRYKSFSFFNDSIKKAWFADYETELKAEEEIWQQLSEISLSVEALANNFQMHNSPGRKRGPKFRVKGSDSLLSNSKTSSSPVCADICSGINQKKWSDEDESQLITLYNELIAEHFNVASNDPKKKTVTEIMDILAERLRRSAKAINQRFLSLKAQFPDLFIERELIKKEKLPKPNDNTFELLSPHGAEDDGSSLDEQESALDFDGEGNRAKHRWKKAEDERLIFLYNESKQKGIRFSNRLWFIAEEFQRSEHAINMRVQKFRKRYPGRLLDLTNEEVIEVKKKNQRIKSSVKCCVQSLVKQVASLDFSNLHQSPFPSKLLVDPCSSISTSTATSIESNASKADSKKKKKNDYTRRLLSKVVHELVSTVVTSTQDKLFEDLKVRHTPEALSERKSLGLTRREVGLTLSYLVDIIEKQFLSITSDGSTADSSKTKREPFSSPSSLNSSPIGRADGQSLSETILISVKRKASISSSLVLAAKKPRIDKSREIKKVVNAMLTSIIITMNKSSMDDESSVIKKELINDQNIEYQSLPMLVSPHGLKQEFNEHEDLAEGYNSLKRKREHSKSIDSSNDTNSGITPSVVASPNKDSRRPKRWTSAEEKLLIEMFNKFSETEHMTIKDRLDIISVKLGRSDKSVAVRFQKMRTKAPGLFDDSHVEKRNHHHISKTLDRILRTIEDQDRVAISSQIFIPQPLNDSDIFIKPIVHSLVNDLINRVVERALSQQ